MNADSKSDKFVVADEVKAGAEAFKAEGNALFKERQFQPAVLKYSEALAAWPGNHVYFANRSICHLKMENYGLALLDAQACIDLGE
jgi:tetratricopeptide (TPR) repeat protein